MQAGEVELRTMVEDAIQVANMNKNGNMADVTYVDFLTHRPQGPEYQRLLQQVAKAAKMTPAKLERSLFDSIKQQNLEQIDYFRVEVPIRDIMVKFWFAGYDYEDVTVKDIEEYINRQPRTEEAKRANEEIDRLAGIQPRALHLYYDPEETAERQNVIALGLARAAKFFIDATPIYTEDEMRQRIAERYSQHGNIITLRAGYMPKPRIGSFNALDNLALAVKTGYRTWSGADGSTRTLMGYIMNLPTDELLAIMAQLGYANLADTVDVFYNLLWFLIYGKISGRNVGLYPTRQERLFISGLRSDDILAILGPDYIGPRDRASLIIAAISGNVTALPDNADIDNNLRYAMLAAAPSSKVWGLASKLYNIVNEKGVPRDYPPHRYLALLNPNPLEDIILSFTENNADAIMQDYGMLSYNYATSKTNFFINEITKYGPVFSRDTNAPQPPNLQDLEPYDRENALKIYTFRELFDAYQVPYSGESRAAYIRKIANTVRLQ